MNYIWEIALRAKPSGMRRDELFFQAAKECSPWYEQSFPCIDQKLLEKTTVEINPLYRFAGIFGELLHEDVDITPEFKAYLFDLAVHLLCEIDLQQGLTKKAFYLRKLEHEVLEQAYGTECKNNFSVLSESERNRLSALILTQIQTGSSLFLFKKSVAVVYPAALIYQLRKEPKKLILYIGAPKTKQREQSVQLLLDLFLPISHSVRIFWEYHFGVFGVDATLHHDEINLF